MGCKDCGSEKPTTLKCKVCGEDLCFVHFRVNNGICKSCSGVGVELPSTIRRSYLDSYRKCPYQAYNYITEKHTQQGNLWSNVGNILHDVFERNSLSFNNTKLEDLLEDAYQQFDEYIINNPDVVERAQQLTKSDVVQKMRDRINTCIVNYLEYEKQAPRPMQTEYYIEFPILQKDGKYVRPHISMTIDRINALENDNCEIVDYKTGKAPGGVELCNGFQVPCYIIGFYHEYGFYPERFKLLYLEDGKDRTFIREGDTTYRLRIRRKDYYIDIDECRLEIQNTITKMLNGQWEIPNTVSDFYCTQFCECYQVGICPGKHLGGWKQKINSKGE